MLPVEVPLDDINPLLFPPVEIDEPPPAVPVEVITGAFTITPIFCFI